MNTYDCKFLGRLKNAIGITHFQQIEVEADTADQAHLKLYDTHEDIMKFQITNISDPKDYKSSKMIH
jgi:hypothetical protein